MPEVLSTERFPATRWSAIRASAAVGTVTRKQGFARLVAAYWRPIYVYLRLRHRCTDSDAHDLTQSFFAQWWEQNTIASFDPSRARADFPALSQLVRGQPLVYLDSAATTQVPAVVIDAVARFSRESRANVHRGIH